MRIFCYWIFFITSCVINVNLLYAANPKDFYTAFWRPYFNQERLSYCNSTGKMCGLPLATAYCKLLGYEKARKVIIENNIGLANYFDVREQCQGWRCNGFKLIECVGEISHHNPSAAYYRLKRFDYPRFNHYRVAWCYKGKTECGKRVAYSFCRRLGYTREHDFAIDQHIHASKTLGDQKLCFGNTCNGFSHITCYR